VRGRVLGVLVAHSTTRTRFVLADVGLLVSIGKQIGLAIQHARLYAAERRAREQTAAILEATRAVTSSLRLEDVLTRAARSIAAVLGQRTCAVWMLNKAGTAFVPSFRVAEPPDAEQDRVFAALPSVPVDAAPRLRELVDTGRPVVMRAGRDLSAPEERIRRMMPFNAYVGVPLAARERVVGVAAVPLLDGGDQVDPEDLEAARAIAGSVGLALENAQLYEQAHQLAVVEERNRLARELHDSVSHALFSMTLISQAMPRLLDVDPARARERIERLNEIGQGALAEMRALIFQLRPAALKDEGLAAALKKHTAAFQSRESVAVTLTINDERRLPEAAEEAVFRVAQEALNNIAKHARATAVEVDLTITASAVTLTVRDNGAGFDPARPHTGEHPTLGMTSMRERAALLGGECRVVSAPGQGTTVRLRLPLEGAV
jgi:signal transduction histidine kinase